MSVFYLESMIGPTTSTEQIIRAAAERALAGDDVVVGRPEWSLHRDRRGWAVKRPDEPYPRFHETADAAAEAMVRGWIHGVHP